MFFKKTKGEIEHAQEYITKYESFLNDYINKDLIKTTEKDETNVTFTSYLKPYKDLLESFSNEIEGINNDINSGNEREKIKKSLNELFNPKNNVANNLLQPVTNDRYDYKTDYKTMISLIEKWEFKSKESDILQDIEKNYSYIVLFNKKIELLEKEKQKIYDNINKYNAAYKKSKDVIKENELNNMIKLIVLSFNILKYETFIALLESVNKVQEEKVGIKTGGTCIRKTQKYIQKKIKKIRKNKKTRKYFYK